MRFNEIVTESDRICPQCGMKGCTCKPGKCGCKPKPGYPKKVDEAANTAQQAAIAIAKQKKVKEESCPHCAGPMFSEELMMEKKDACYYKVKSRYKVWPSAYASGALVKCRKKGAKNWGTKSESVEELDENLHQWFKEKWVRFGPDGKIRGDCARGDDSEGKPKCLPQSKAHSLGKAGRKYAASKKRREDPNPERHGPAKNVATKKKSNESVAEAVVPDQKLQSSILYHGTPTKSGYQGISSQGLKLDPELIAQKYKGQENFAPLPGVYMTKEFGNAVRYSFMSNVSDDQYAEYIKQEPNGYVFEFSGKDLTTVTPDEDELGSLLIQLVKNKNLQPNLLKIVQAVPEELRIKLQQPRVDFETIAVAGKWLVNRISDSTIQYLMKRYHNVVNYGGIKPSAVWVIPKPNERFLRDRQGTFNTHNGYVNYAKKFGKKYDLTEVNKRVAEGKVKLYTDPGYFGAEVDDTEFDSLAIVDIPANQLVGFEPDDKMNQPKSKANVEKIVAGLKQGAKLPPLLVRKYKNGYQVLDGHHRFWAYKLLGVKSIPSRIVPDEDIEEISKQGVAEGSGGNWYIRVNGKILNDTKFKPEIFSSEDEARSHAMKLADKKRIPLSQIKLTKSWMDAPEQGVAESVAEHIVKVKGGWELKSKHGDKNLGKYPTKAGAEKRERQVQYFKHANEAVEQGVAEGATVTRIDSKPITDFGSSLKGYKHTDDWSQSGVDTGDDSYWKNKNLKTNTTKGLFAGDPRRTALYATGNAHETRYVEFTQDGQPIVYFDQKDLPAIRSRKTYLTVFDASDFRQLPTGEWFSENPGKPIKQVPIGDPFKYIADQGWIVRVTDDLDKVFKQVKNMHKAGKIAQYGAEGMNESKQGVAEGENWSKYNHKRVGGMSKKSVSSYRRSHPGSKIQTAVTTKPSKLKKGSKAAARRKSFCARMRGMKKHRTGAKTARDPNSNINKSLRRWHCESVQELQELVMIAEQKIRNLKK